MLERTERILGLNVGLAECHLGSILTNIHLIVLREVLPHIHHYMVIFDLDGAATSVCDAVLAILLIPDRSAALGRSICVTIVEGQTQKVLGRALRRK